MPAADALTVRTRIAEQLEGQTFPQIVDGYVTAQGGDYGVKITGAAHGTFKDEARMQMYGANALRRVVSTLAETFYISPEMHQLVQMAAEDFPEDEAILKEDQPSEAGVLYLPEALRFREVRGRWITVRVLVWCNNRVWTLTDREDPADEVSQELRAEFGELAYRLPRYDLSGYSGFAYGKPFPGQVVVPEGVRIPGHDKRGLVQIEVNQDMIASYTDKDGVRQEIELQTQPSSELRYLLAAWRLMQQTLASVDVEDKHPKPAMRYAQRARIPTRVVVIALRRTESHPTGTGPKMSYRTITRGHWRRVWCGPLSEPDKRYKRAVYIHPYLRGPADGPLIIRDRVNALLR